MEMHLNSIVVSLLDGQGKAFREYEPKLKDNTRRCNIFMPFDTEYKILIKNSTSGRLRMDIDIDGSSVSGRGIIVNANSVEKLERFVDAAKRFKFVKAVGEGSDPDVADPTNPENGIVKVKLYEENPPLLNMSLFNTNGNWGYRHPDVTWWNSNDYRNATMYSSNCSITATSSIGATVEGGISEQKFHSVSWNGDKDSDPFTFTFYVRGDNTLNDDPDYKEYLRLKTKFGH